MPKVFVTCPTCTTKLELADEYLGQTVQCGSCHQEFEAKRDRPHRDEDDRPPRRKNRFRRDDDDDDDDDDLDDDRPRRRRRRRSEDNTDHGDVGLGIAALVMGLVSLPGMCCWPLGVSMALGAITCGSLGMKTRDGKGMATAGLILGIISLVLLVSLLALGLGLNVMNFGNRPGRFR